METNKNKDQNQGKQSNAKTDETYNRNAGELKNSATTSQNSATSPSKMGAGGIMRDDRHDSTPLDEAEGKKDKA